MNVPRLWREMHDRWVEGGNPDYVFWIPVLVHLSSFVAVAAAVIQRVPTDGLWPNVVWGLVAWSPWLYNLTGRLVSWPIFIGLAAVGSAMLMSGSHVAFDFAPAIIALAVGDVAGTTTVRRSLSAAVIATVALIGLDLGGLFDGLGFWIATVVIAWDIGFILRYQQLQLERQTLEAEERHTKAALEERQRIAREVHDVVAHSLSVTMLHLTAARRDLEQDGDIEEAVSALRDAEQLGRQAMADIRRTVGLLGQTPGEVAAAPDVLDVPALVEEFRRAGLAVSYDVLGDATSLVATTSLGLFRIAQESLANVAKHQPNAAARVLLDVRPGRRSLTVVNQLHDKAPLNPGGSGISGIRQRAELFGGSVYAGEVAGHWKVRVSFDEATESNCPLPSAVKNVFHKPLETA